MRKYHVVLADQSERDILADALEVVEGALVFKDTYG